MENNEHIVVAKTSKKAIASLVFNLVWLFGLGSIFAIILGHMARTEVKKSNGSLKGDGLALGSLAVGYIVLFFTVVMILKAIPMFAKMEDAPTEMKKEIQAKEEFLSKIVEGAQNKFPMQLNDEALYLKITSDSPNSIVGHIKYVNYTTADLLEGLTTKEFEEELLKQELQAYCKESGVQLIIKKGIIHHIKYYDKDDIAFAQISITNEQCKPYY